MELPKFEYQSPSKFVLSLSMFFLTVMLILIGFYYYKFSELTGFIKTIIDMAVLLLLIVFAYTLYVGIKLLKNEDKSKRVRDAIERDILLREYWIKCIEYNQKAKEYNKKYKTPVFPEKGALEFPQFLKEADSFYMDKIEKEL